MNQRTKNIPAARKAVTVLSVITSILVVVFAALQLFHIWDRSVNLCLPLLGVVNSCQAYLFWKSSRRIAWFCAATAVFILFCSFVVFFV